MAKLQRKTPAQKQILFLNFYLKQMLVVHVTCGASLIYTLVKISIQSSFSCAASI